ncbi:MAG: HTH-type transcriptional regulator TtgR [Candidatus Celerinatantimonas neptuna]|nr:MAG: HTH-type transcriptional regulator TtgR [Candidatus Celerinatantimonas neptuna]
MARKTKEEAQKTRQFILDSALRLFCQQGIAETSLTDIASEAGVTRGAIYWHFKNKHELLLTLWDELCKPLEYLMDASIDENEPDPLGKLQTFLTKILQNIATNPAQRQMFSILFTPDSEHNDIIELRQHSREQYQKFSDELQKALTNAIQKKQLSEKFDAQLGAKLLCATMNGNALRLIRTGDDFPLETLAEPVVNLLFKMMENYKPE